MTLTTTSGTAVRGPAAGQAFAVSTRPQVRRTGPGACASVHRPQCPPCRVHGGGACRPVPGRQNPAGSAGWQACHAHSSSKRTSEVLGGVQRSDDLLLQPAGSIFHVPSAPHLRETPAPCAKGGGDERPSHAARTRRHHPLTPTQASQAPMQQDLLRSRKRSLFRMAAAFTASTHACRERRSAAQSAQRARSNHMLTSSFEGEAVYLKKSPQRHRSGLCK